MTLTLADSSIWVDYLRYGSAHPDGSELQEALDAGTLVTCGPVVAELLAGTREGDRPRLADALRALT